jgi:hypothetical protein
MSDDQDFIIDGRPVPELKVVELRKELEQRSLPKSGNKKELVERLLNYLREEQAEQNRQEEPEQQEDEVLTAPHQQEQEAPAAQQQPESPTVGGCFCGEIYFIMD